ncbi:MAG TPA: rhomboid family intramembrane serine protease [Pseudolabrys sp.]|nr:rhomboid family intramembrane serine protease [Pseudolabrys sp.]
MNREPAFNVPPVIVGLLAVLAAIHLVRTMLLTPAQDDMMLGLLVFDPLRYESGLLPGGALPGGFGAEVWTFFTYALIHASWMHYGVNAIWLLPFGSALARRFGPWRFLAFFAVTAALGAFAHLVAYAGENAPVIGASAAISGTMAGAMRFVFQPGGPLSFFRTGEDGDFQVPAIPLLGVLRDARVLLFLIVWFGINMLFGASSMPMMGLSPGETVAWQAHIGGFLGGLLIFSWFDPAPGNLRSGAPRH